MVERGGPFHFRLGLVELLDAPVDAVRDGSVGERVEIGRLHAAARLLDDARLGHVNDFAHRNLLLNESTKRRSPRCISFGTTGHENVPGSTPCRGGGLARQVGAWLTAPK